MKIGYMRCTTEPDRKEVMERLGVDELFVDICTDKKTSRPQLQAMLESLRERDVVITESFGDLARNARDLLVITDKLRKKGADYISLEESSSLYMPENEALLMIIGAISKLEKKYMLERQAEGMAKKKLRGEYKGRAPIKVDGDKFAEVYQRWKSGAITAKAAMECLGLKPNTFYRRVKEYEAGLNK